MSMLCYIDINIPKNDLRILTCWFKAPYEGCCPQFLVDENMWQKHETVLSKNLLKKLQHLFDIHRFKSIHKLTKNANNKPTWVL